MTELSAWARSRIAEVTALRDEASYRLTLIKAEKWPGHDREKYLKQLREARRDLAKLIREGWKE